MGKEIHIQKVIESMQATVDSLSEELLTAIDREKNIPQETALSSYVFNASLGKRELSKLISIAISLPKWAISRLILTGR